MADLNDLVRNINALLAGLPEFRKREAQILASDNIAIIKDRIIERGEKADGGQLGTYSEKKVPYWYYKNKDSNRNAAEQAEKMRKKVGYFASYKDWREQHSLPTSHITLSFTANMWKGVKHYVTQHDISTTLVEIKGSDDYTQEKIDGNSARYGNILALSDSEIADLEQDYAERLDEYLSKYIL